MRRILSSAAIILQRERTMPNKYEAGRGKGKGWSPVRDLSLAEYLSARSQPADNGCRLWTGAVYEKGHGKFRRNYKEVRAHRAAFELANGPIPSGQVVCHRCDNPRCINPDHLFLGTVADNNLDMIRKNRHAFGARNGAAKLTDWRVRVIRRAARSGLPVSEIARRLGLSQSTVSHAASGQTWRHISDHIKENRP